MCVCVNGFKLLIPSNHENDEDENISLCTCFGGILSEEIESGGDFLSI